MEKDYIQINERDLIPVATIRRLREVTDADRESLQKLGPQVDASRFRTRIDLADGAKRYAPESLAEIEDQGVPLIETGMGGFVIAANVVSASNLTLADRKDFEGRTGRSLSEQYRAQVDTRAGMVLSTVSAEVIMRWLNNPQPMAPRRSLDVEPTSSDETTSHPMP